LTVATLVGGKSRSAARVSPGKQTIRLLRTAFCKVVSVGKNNAAWANATNSPVLSTWLTMCVLCCSGAVVGTVGAIVGSSTGTAHSRVVGFLCPLRMVEFKYWMLTRCLSKTAVHPTSHNSGLRTGGSVAAVLETGGQ
jgi:hypothetical protein